MLTEEHENRKFSNSFFLRFTENLNYHEKGLHVDAGSISDDTGALVIQGKSLVRRNSPESTKAFK